MKIYLASIGLLNHFVESTPAEGNDQNAGDAHIKMVIPGSVLEEKPWEEIFNREKANLKATRKYQATLRMTLQMITTFSQLKKSPTELLSLSSGFLTTLLWLRKGDDKTSISKIGPTLSVETGWMEDEFHFLLKYPI